MTKTWLTRNFIAVLSTGIVELGLTCRQASSPSICSVYHNKACLHTSLGQVPNAHAAYNGPPKIPGGKTPGTKDLDKRLKDRKLASDWPTYEGPSPWAPQ